MLSLLIKEVKGFLSSVTGYLVIIVYLILNGLLLWVLPSAFNLLNYGYASLDNYFMLAPWLFLFLVPAITMRTFSEENKSGTIELLLTKPISEMGIIMAKYLASVLLILLSIAPTLIYYISIYMLGNPVGNIDTGGTWGAFIGLFFLASSFAAIGVFSSGISSNQVVAFIIAFLLSIVMYIGSDFVAGINIFNKVAYFIEQLGINTHYINMSKGVIDTRDVIYFLSLIAFFLLITRFNIEKRKW
ncbi:MAG: gliding motility-associated ABC transporter permease subunit GldF [Lentimicrobiaceae bacterium]|nr:gliding motility-associated ABC transporter permease subunit GldF [Lentimicrobiaceae bacterium]